MGILIYNAHEVGVRAIKVPKGPNCDMTLFLGAKPRRKTIYSRLIPAFVLRKTLKRSRSASSRLRTDVCRAEALAESISAGGNRQQARRRDSRTSSSDQRRSAKAIRSLSDRWSYLRARTVSCGNCKPKIVL